VGASVVAAVAQRIAFVAMAAAGPGRARLVARVPGWKGVPHLGVDNTTRPSTLAAWDQREARTAGSDSPSREPAISKQPPPGRGSAAAATEPPPPPTHTHTHTPHPRPTLDDLVRS
jgi:hypothetical protein